MPVNGMNVGVDYSITFYDANSGTLINLGDVQDVKITEQKHDISSRPYNRTPRFAFVPDGFKIDFNIVRTSSVLEDFMVAYSQAFNQGQVQAAGYLNESIVNPDGTVRRYQYTNFVFFLTNHGDISREKTVILVGEGMASDKVQIA